MNTVHEVLKKKKYNKIQILFAYDLIHGNYCLALLMNALT